VQVRVLPDRFGGSSTRHLSAHLDGGDPATRLLVQYVPNVFGRSGANTAFCRWLLARRMSGQDIRVMFHEPYLYYRWRPDHFAIALAQRWMAATMLRAATQVYVSTGTWRRYLAPFGNIDRAIDLPIPSAIPCVDDRVAVAARRNAIGRDGPILGHFGTYGSHISPLVGRALTAVLGRRQDAVATCAGAGSDLFVADLIRREPTLHGRVHGTGRVDAREVSIALQACDLVLQPYPDGVTTRRTSLMAALANGSAVLTTDGALTEPMWHSSRAVALAPSADAAAFTDRALRLLDDHGERAALAERGRDLYAERFDLAHTISALVGPADVHE
jgi:glycosyltransferase involved in cell wall biosynthesis